jgi:hypothetical protein
MMLSQNLRIFRRGMKTVLRKLKDLKNSRSETIGDSSRTSQVELWLTKLGRAFLADSILEVLAKDLLETELITLWLRVKLNFQKHHSEVVSEESIRVRTTLKVLLPISLVANLVRETQWLVQASKSSQEWAMARLTQVQPYPLSKTQC